MALNRVSDRSTGDWLSQTHVKNYGNFLCLMIQFFFQWWKSLKSTPVYIIKNIFAQLGYAEKELKTNSTCAKWHKKIPKHDDNLWSID